MLTKEKCLFALESFKPANIYEFEAKGYLPFTEANSILTQLINEHFELVKDFMQLVKDFMQLEKSYDNLYDKFYNLKPLKFEEIHEGMWIWDNKMKEYIKCATGINSLNELCVFYWYNCFNLDGELEEDYIKFEENRFYRREVNNDE